MGAWPGDDFRTKTIEESALLSDALDEASPGLVVIFSDGRPKRLAIRLDKKPIEIGRVPSEGVFVVEDDRVSRRHTRISIKGDSVRVTDLDSRNGVFVDGKRVLDETFPRLQPADRSCGGRIACDARISGLKIIFHFDYSSLHELGTAENQRRAKIGRRCFDGVGGRRSEIIAERGRELRRIGRRHLRSMRSGIEIDIHFAALARHRRRLLTRRATAGRVFFERRIFQRKISRCRARSQS